LCHTRVILIGACLLIGLHSREAMSTPTLAPLPLAEALRIVEIDHRFRVSPDGQWVAYVLRDRSKRNPVRARHGTGGAEGQDIWIVNTVSGVSKNLTNGKGSSWNPTWSPDGKRVAFTSDRGGRPQLWIWERRTNKIRRASDAVLRQYGNASGWLTWSYLQWTPDGRHVLTKLLPEGMTEDELETYIRVPRGSSSVRPLGESAVTVYKAGTVDHSLGARAVDPLQQNYRQKQLLGDIGLIDVETGHVRRLAKRVHATRYDLSPDGSHVAFLHSTAWSHTLSLFEHDLVVTSIDTAKPTVLMSPVRQIVVGMSMTWSPDSRHVLYVDGSGSDAMLYSIARDAVYDGSSSAVRALIRIPSSIYFHEQALPLWDASGTHLFLAAYDRLQQVSMSGGDPRTVVTIPDKQIIRLIDPALADGGRQLQRDGQSVFVEVLDPSTQHRTIQQVDLSSGQSREVSHPGSRTAHTLASETAASLGEPVVYRFTDATHVPDLWVARVDGTRQRLTRSNEVFDSYVLGEPRMIDWVNSQGVPRRGALLLPAGYQPGERYPLLVWVYGTDSLSSKINEFGFGGALNNMHLLATRGYAVLFPDSSVSTGTAMSDIAGNVLPGVDKAIQLGIADPERLGVFGHSFGGYSTMSIIAQTTRFRAAINYAGVANLTSVYGAMMDENGLSETVSMFDGRMGGSPWEYRERYIENSPWFYLDRVETPLLLLCGDQDLLHLQASEVFVGLRRLGKTVEYAKYRGVGHTIAYYPALIDYWERVIAWFDAHLSVSPGTTEPR